MTMDSVVLLALGLAVILLVMAAILSARYNIWKEASISGARAIIQLLILSSVIILVFNLPVYWSLLIVLAMAVIAGHTTYIRSGQLGGMFPASAASIAITSLAMVVPFFIIGIFPLEARYLVPTCSMMIGNAMNVSSLAIDRYKESCATAVGRSRRTSRWARPRAWPQTTAYTRGYYLP